MRPDADFDELSRLSSRGLETLISTSRSPRAEDLAGWEWRGLNLAWFTSVLGIRKFIKGFFESPEGVEGYNIPVSQNGRRQPWAHRPSAESPKRFGFYRVAPVAAESLDCLYPQALLLDYGASRRNAFYRVERVLRDYVVQPKPDDPDVLLGKAYLALGPARVPSNFFLIQRLRRTDWKG